MKKASRSLSIARRFIDADAFADQCVERAGGNPLFLEQLLRGAGDLVDEVELAARQRLVEHRPRELAQPLAVALERARREVAREHAPPLRVQWRVGLHEVPARLEHVLRHRLDQRRAAGLRGERRCVLEHLDDVVVARHAPEAVPVGHAQVE